jgi:hypothetical protein
LIALYSWNYALPQAEDSSKANCFSAEAFEEMGEYAIGKPQRYCSYLINKFFPACTGDEFWDQVLASSFGERLRAYACSLDGLDKPDFLSEVAFMNPSKMRIFPRRAKLYWGDATRVMENMSETWGSITWNITIDSVLPQLVNGLVQPILFDKMWYDADLLMWNAAMALDKPNDPGQVAKVFGLVNPHDPNRPTCMRACLRSYDRSRQLEAVTASAPAPPPRRNTDPSFPSAQTVAKTGHAYLAENRDNKPKDKPKTRGIATVEVDEKELDSLADDEPEAEDLPLALPAEYKLGRRHLKVGVSNSSINYCVMMAFRYSNEFLPMTQKRQAKIAPIRANSNGTILRRYQSCSAGFGFASSLMLISRKAMRRIGFDVIQTAGSSVRFDPPAQTARPITFHRVSPSHFSIG